MSLDKARRPTAFRGLNSNVCGPGGGEGEVKAGVGGDWSVGDLGSG